MAACPTILLQREDQKMVWLSDLMAAIDRHFGPASQRSKRKRKQVQLLEATANHIAAVICDLPYKEIKRDLHFKKITIEALVDVDDRLKAYFKNINLSTDTIQFHFRNKKWMLEHAHRSGWTCTGYELRLSWKPLYDFRRGKRMSFGTIAIEAIKDGVFADQYSDKHVLAWGDKQKSGPDADRAIAVLRALIRNGRLEKHFPLLDVSLRALPPYIRPLPVQVTAQIQQIYTWDVLTAPPEFLKSVTYAEKHMTILRELSSYATSHGGDDIDDIRQVITEDRVDGWVNWRVDVRKNLPGTILTDLRSLNGLVQQHELFKQADFKWLALMVDRIINEQKWVRRERKHEKLVPHRLLKQVPAKIRAERLATPALTPEQFARSVHNELFMSMPPWRSKNHSGVSIALNILESEMTDDLWDKLTYIPSWMEEVLSKDEHHQFVFFHFVEPEMKGKKEIWEVMDPDLEPLYSEYRGCRHLLLRKSKTNPEILEDHHNLFVGRDGRAMGTGGLRRLMAEISDRYLPKRLAHHLRRDCVVVGMIVAGATFEEVGAALHHGSQESTDIYTSGLPAVSCAEVLEEEIDELRLEFDLDFT